MSLSPAAALARAGGVESWLAGLSDAEALDTLTRWRFWARPEQLLPPGDWRTALYLAGRGWGKTRTGAEAVREMVETRQAGRIALVAPTASDARDVMVEGESGILACSPPSMRPNYQPSVRRLTWPNGAIATTYSADEPERLRGPQHDFAWADELGAWRYPATWDMLMFGLRLGNDPKKVVTTTPKPIPLLIGDGKEGRPLGLLRRADTVVIRGATRDNAMNLAPSFLAEITARYGGTRLGRQELEAEVLEEIAGAMWTREALDAARCDREPELVRIVVAIDPAVTSGEESDETGIVVVGKDRLNHGYVLSDQSGRYAPIEWAQLAARTYHQHGADRIVAEVNNGGEMVEATIRMIDPEISYSAVRATRGKVRRAEPVAALYEQGRIHHVGSFAKLEDQMCAFTADFDAAKAGYSPDRVDALVWGLTELFVEERRPFVFGTL